MANDKMYKRSLKVYIDGTEVENSVNGINREIRKLKGEMRNLTIGTEEYERKARQLRELDGILQRHRRNIRGVGEEYTSLSARLGKFADGVNRYMGVVAGAVGAVTGLTMTVRKTVDDYAKMEDVMANVRKYTGQTDEEVREMNEDFKKMDTRTSREQLNELAGAAGRLGITNKDLIEEFVDGADKIGVALGDDLGEGAVDTIGKLAIAFGEDKNKGLRGAMLATGSALNELVANSPAKAQPVIEFTEKLSGVGQMAHLTQAQIMGYAAALDQNNQEMATASTVMSQLITKMYQDPARFAQMAGMEVKKFKELIHTDMNQAIVEWLQHVNKLGDMSVLAGKFDELKMDGTRAVGVLSTLAGHVDQVTEAQRIATEAYEEGTSVIEEFNIQNSTVQAELDKAKQDFLDISVALGEKLLPIAKYGITTGSTIVKLLSVIVNFASKHIATIITVTTTLTALIAVEKIDIDQKKLMDFWNLKVKDSAKKLFDVIKANPWALVATAIAAVIGLLIDYTRRTRQMVTAQKIMVDVEREANAEAEKERLKLEQLRKVVHDNTRSMDERRKAIEELKSIVPGYVAEISKEGRVYDENTAALDRYIKKLKEEAMVRGAEKKIEEMSTQWAELEAQRLETEQKERERRERNARGPQGVIPGAMGSTWSNQAQEMVSEGAGRQILNTIQQKQKDLQQAIDRMGEIVKNAKTIAGESPETPEIPDSPVSPEYPNKTKTKIDDAKELREALARIEAEYTEKQNTLRKQYISGELQDRNTLNEEIEKLELAKLNAMLGVANLEPKKRAEIAEKIMGIEMNLRDKVETLMQSLGTTDEQRMQDELNSLQQKFGQEQSTIKQAYERELMTKEEYQEADRKLTEKYDEESRKVRESYAERQLATLEASHEKELLTLDERRVREMMSEEQYQQELYELRKSGLEKELEQLNLSEEKRTELLNELRRLRIEQEDEQNKREVANLKDKYSDMQNAAQSFGQAFGSAMEEIFAGEEDAFKHFFQSLIKQVLDFLEKMLIAKTAQRTIDSIGTMGIAGIAKAAAEIALITAAFETAKAAIGSFDIGGFTGNGEWNEPRGIVHAGEFVANRHAVRNPSVLPVLSVIDQAQRTGTIANLTASDIAAVLPTRSAVSPVAPTVSGDNAQRFDTQELIAMLSSVDRTLNAVINRFKDPIRAETYATGKHGTIEAEGLVQRMRNNVTRQKH